MITVLCHLIHLVFARGFKHTFKYLLLNLNGTSLFSIVNNAAQTNSQLSSNLTIINDWAYKWKMSFNLIIRNHPMKLLSSFAYMINNGPVKSIPCQKQLGQKLHSKLDFNELINTVLLKVDKMIALLRKLPFNYM